jgi:16S rRNA G966 N2-methylase RsmD
VERERAALRALRDNVADLGADAEVVAADARAFLRAARDGGAQYDLVFLDPPYRVAAGLAQELDLAPVVANGGRVVGESDRRDPLELDLPLTDERRYGDTLIRIYALT